MSDDIGLLMNPDFEPKPKDNVVVSRPVQQISLAGNYCFVLCDNVLQIYLNCNFSVIQMIKNSPLCKSYPLIWQRV